MSNCPKKIGIMGGTFDPIHYGHLRAADEAHAALGLSEVIFIPTGQPPHKINRFVSSSEDRYNMTLLATIYCSYFSVSRLEIDQDGFSYTVDTLTRLKMDPKYNNSSFYFITGLDAVLDIVSWKTPIEIFKLCKFVAVSRYGYTHKRVDQLPENIRKHIIPLEIPLLAISSTELRDRVSRDWSIKFLVPPSVEDYIAKKNLYKNTI
ncbi:MAG: nicotinate-nucleotide adenylyltransferase [Synergistaceae bacterium]